MADRSPESRRGPYWPKLLLLGVSAIFVLATAEVFARLIWPDPPPRPTPPEVAEDLPVLQTVAELGAPNAVGLHRGVLHRVNSQGFRGPDYTRAPGSDVFRIGIGGDSVTAGWGVAEADMYTQQLETILNEGSSDRRYEVLNFGLAGIDSETVVKRLRKGVRTYRPHLLIYGFTVNDIENGAFVASPSPGLRDWERARWAEDSPSYLLRWVWPRVISARQLFFAPPGSKLYDFRHNYFENPEAWGRFTASLDRLAKLAESSGVCAGVLIHTQLTFLGYLHPYSSIYDRVEEAAVERGLFVVPTLDDYRGYNELELWVAQVDPHPNRKGHEILARALAERLPELGERCWGR